MLVRVTHPGFYDGSLRAVGEVFDLADGLKPGKWMEIVAVEKAPKAEKADKAVKEKASKAAPVAKEDDAESLA